MSGYGSLCVYSSWYYLTFWVCGVMFSIQLDFQPVFLQIFFLCPLSFSSLSRVPITCMLLPLISHRFMRFCSFFSCLFFSVFFSLGICIDLSSPSLIQSLPSDLLLSLYCQFVNSGYCTFEAYNFYVVNIFSFCIETYYYMIAITFSFNSLNISFYSLIYS